MAERFLREVPTAWDETELLSGDPESHVLLARRNGPHWYVGAVTAGAARTIAVPLAAGLNTIRATATTTNGGPNIDFLNVS